MSICTWKDFGCELIKRKIIIKIELDQKLYSLFHLEEILKELIKTESVKKRSLMKYKIVSNGPYLLLRTCCFSLLVTLP